MDKREEAAALRESLRLNGKAQAGSDDDSDLEGDKPPAPIKVRNGAVVTVRCGSVQRALVACFFVGRGGCDVGGF